ncbi:MAG: hypothetical protein ABEJ98_04085 [Candidatus Nanohaloarchaea archaeon]
MESSLRYEELEPWFDKSFFERPVDYDSVLYDRVDDSFYTVIPDASTGIESAEEIPAVLERTVERLEGGDPPYLLAPREVDALLQRMFNFDAFDYLEAAETEALELSQRERRDFIPARVDSGEPSALMYSGPTSYAFSDFDPDIL